MLFFLKCLLIQLTLISVGYGYVNNFRLGVFFEDINEVARPLVIDITTSESFVLHSTEFWDLYDRKYVYKPTASQTFKNLTSPFSSSYLADFNNGSSTVKGFLAQDKMKIMANYYNSTFGVVTGISGDPNVIGFDGEPNAGRLGFSRNKGITSLSNDLYEDDPRILCLDIGIHRDNKYIRRTTSAIGGYHYTPKRFRTKVQSISHPEGLWKINVNKFSIGTFGSLRNFVTTFTSTFNGITVPSLIYQRAIRTLGAKFDRENNRYIVDCEKDVPIKIGVNGTEISVRYDAYTEPITSESKECELKLRETKDPSTLILGVPFFVDNGVCFNNDNGEVHFYNASFDNTDVALGATSDRIRKFVETEIIHA